MGGGEVLVKDISPAFLYAFRKLFLEVYIQLPV